MATKVPSLLEIKSLFSKTINDKVSHSYQTLTEKDSQITVSYLEHPTLYIIKLTGTFAASPSQCLKTFSSTSEMKKVHGDDLIAMENFGSCIPSLKEPHEIIQCKWRSPAPKLGLPNIDTTCVFYQDSSSSENEIVTFSASVIPPPSSSPPEVTNEVTRIHLKEHDLLPNYTVYTVDMVLKFQSFSPRTAVLALSKYIQKHYVSTQRYFELKPIQE